MIEWYWSITVTCNQLLSCLFCWVVGWLAGWFTHSVIRSFVRSFIHLFITGVLNPSHTPSRAKSLDKKLSFMDVNHLRLITKNANIRWFISKPREYNLTSSVRNTSQVARGTQTELNGFLFGNHILFVPISLNFPAKWFCSITHKKTKLIPSCSYSTKNYLT